MKNLNIEKNIFSFVSIGVLLGASLLIILLNTQGLVNWDNFPIFQIIVQILFCFGVIFVANLALDKPLKLKSLLNHRSLLIFSLCMALTLCYKSKTSETAAAIFILFSLFYLFKEKKFYALNKVYICLFLYAALRVFGTIGTPQGFHFPDKMLLFFLLPLAFSCFRLKEISLLKILKFFFRINFIYLCCSLLFWTYNSFLFDLPAINWFFNKFDESNIISPVYTWVSSWSLYTHPSFNSLTVIFALISGYYLRHRNEKNAKINNLELFISFILTMVFIILVKSRIGFVLLTAVSIATVLIYAKQKRQHYKKILSATIILGICSLFFFNNFAAKIGNDNARKGNTILAIEYIKEHPLWGCGYYQQKTALEGQFEKMKDKFPIKGYTEPNAYVHNQFIGDTLQFGFIGLFVLLLLLYQIFRYAISRKSYPLQMLLLSLVLFMLIEEPFYMQPGITRVTLFLCLFIALADAKKENDNGSNEEKELKDIL